MGVEVDWSKAPEGATHYAPKREESCFYRAVFWRVKAGRGVEAWSINDDGSLQHYDRPAWIGSDINRLIPRPTAWTGGGLPPVGTVCEVLNSALDRPEWERCTILFMGKFKAVYESESCHERVADVSEDWMISFRPLRTPEQIAAEERLHEVRNACTSIADTLDGLRGKTKIERAALSVVEAMIAVGYRKVTP